MDDFFFKKKGSRSKRKAHPGRIIFDSAESIIVMMWTKANSRSMELRDPTSTGS